MPAFNSEAFIKEAISSVLVQTFRELELIIVDDGSTDNTKNIAEVFMAADSRVKYFFQENGGQGKARNLGINSSAGDFIAFLDADDVWSPDKLTKQMALFNNVEIGLVYCDAECIGESKFTGVLGSQISKPFVGLVTKQLIWKNFIANSSVVVRRNILELVGLFNETNNFRTIEDYDLWLRASRFCKFGFLNENLVKYRYVQKINSVADSLKSYRKTFFLYFGLLKRKIFFLYMGDILVRIFSIGFRYLFFYFKPKNF